MSAWGMQEWLQEAAEARDRAGDQDGRERPKLAEASRQSEILCQLGFLLMEIRDALDRIAGETRR